MKTSIEQALPEAQEGSAKSNDTRRMDPALKAKWIEALRSGKYEQVTSRLRRSGGFCCLGVLCDVSPEIEWQGETAVFGRDQGPDATSDDAELPRGFARLLHFTDDIESALVNMNDGNVVMGIQRRTFAEIADWIEQNL